MMWRKENKEEGVSAVIAVILMVAITVVLAGVLYVWVMNMAQTGGSNNVTIGLASQGKSGKYYIWSVASVQGSAPIQDIEIRVLSNGAVIRSDNFGSISATDNTTYQSYIGQYIIILDNDKDNYLTEGDTIKLWANGVNTGDTLEIYVGGNRATSAQIS